MTTSLFLAAPMLPAAVAHDVETPFCTETSDATRTGPYAVCTDRDDYPPPSIVHVRGTGFDGLSSLTVKITRPDGTVVSGLRADDGSALPWPQPYDTVAADDAGSFEYDYDLHGIEGTFLVEVGLLSDDASFSVLATHTFTDATTDWKQCENVPAGNGCTWTNGALGNSNSRYIEGMSVPQRLLISAFSVSGSTHTVDFKHEASRSSVHAYDFLTSYEQSQAVSEFLVPGQNLLNPIDGCAGFSGVLLTDCQKLRGSANKAAVSAPDAMGSVGGDDVAARASAYEALWGDRVIRIYALPEATAITGASLTFTGYTGGTNKDANYRLTWTSSSSKVLIEMGTHLAVGASRDGTGDAYGAGKGAGSISGGPYGINVISVDGGPGTGANTISGAAVQSVTNTAQIRVALDTVPNDATVFSFATTGLTPSSFSLDDDGVLTNALSNTRTFSYLSPGTYTVTLTKLTGYTYATSACAGTVTQTASAVQVSFTTTTANNGQTLACTFTSNKVASLATSLVAASSPAVYGGSTDLSATLTSSGSPLGGKTIAFSLNGAAVGSATTGPDGVATLAGVSVAGINAGSYPGANGASFAGDTDHAASSATATLTVGKASQTITFGELAGKTYGDAPFAVSASATSGLPVAFAAAGPCSVSGTQVTIAGAGDCTITASQSGNANYDAAPNVPRTFTIAPATQTITFDAPATKTYLDAPFDVTASASSGLPVAIARLSGPCSLSGTQVALTGAGDCVLEATQPGDPNYLAAPAVQDTIVIARTAQTITFDAIAAKTYGDGDFGLSAVSSSGLPVSFAYDAGPCELVGASTVHIEGAGDCRIRASQAGDADFLPAPDAFQTFNIAKADQTIDFAELPGKTYGDAPFTLSATASSGLTVSFAATGPCSVSGTQVTVTGAGECTVTASQSGDADFNAAPNVVRAFTIDRASQTIAFTAIGPLTYGDAPVTLSATATSGLPVTFLASGSCSIGLDGKLVLDGAGACTVTAEQGGNADWYPAPDDVQLLHVAKADQTIDVVPIGPLTYGDAPVTLSATATSGLPVTFTASGACSIGLDGKLAIDHAGTCTVTASQGGNADWNAAPDVVLVLTVAKQDQTIDFTPIGALTYGDAPATLSATATSGLTVSFSASGACSIDLDGDLAIDHAGECTVTASQGGNGDWNPAPDVPQAITIAKKDQTIDFPALATPTYGDADMPLAATASSGLPVSFAATGACSIGLDGDLVIEHAGACTVTASQGGDGDWNPAPDVSQVLTIAKKDQTIDFTPIGALTYGDAPATLSATATSGLTVSLSASGSCSIDLDGKLAIEHAGECTVTASQGGNGDWNPAPDVPQAITIAKKDQTIDFAPIGALTYGDAPVTLSATATSGLPVTFSASGACSIDLDGKLAIDHAGDCTVTASQDGNGDWNAAPDVTQTPTVAKQDQTISFTDIAAKTFGDADFDLVATATSGLPVAFAVLSGPCVLASSASVRITGAGACVVQATQEGDADWNPAPDVERTVDIAKADQAITWPTIPDPTYGDAPIGLAATASSGLPVSFAAAGTCDIVGATLRILGAGDCTVTASQGGDPDWNPAPDVVQELDVAKAPQTIAFAELPGRTYGDAPFDLSATATSGLPVAYAASGTCAVSGSQVTITGAGGCTITASQDGDPDFLPAPDVARAFTIARAPQTITFSAIGPLAYGATPVTLVATASSGLPVSFSAIGGCSIGPSGTLVIEHAGACTVTASQGGSPDFEPASDEVQLLEVAKADQTIDVAAIGPLTYGDAPVTLSATATSGLPVSFSASGACSIGLDGALVIDRAGDCVLTASQGGNGDWNAADDVVLTLTVAKKDQTIDFPALGALTYGDGPVTLAATATSGLPVSFSATGVCSIGPGGTLVLDHAGACTVTASQGGDPDWNPAPDVAQALDIAKASQTITFAELDGRTYGDAPFDLAATATSGLPVAFDVAGACTLSGVTVTITGAGACAVTASQPGDPDFHPADDVERSFDIARAPQTITFKPIPDATFGDKDFDLGATASSGLPIGYAATGDCTVTGATVHILGAGSCVITASQGGDPDHLPADDVERTLVIHKADQTIDLALPKTATYGDAPVAVDPTATSGLPVLVSATGPCSLVAGELAFTGAGTCTVTASQGGDPDWNAAPDLVLAVVVSPAPTTVTLPRGTLSTTWAQFSDTLPVEATVSTTVGDGVFEGTLVFRLNGYTSPPIAVSHLAPTVSSTIRLDATTVPTGAGDHEVHAIFTPSAGSNYAGSGDETTVKVQPEGATATGGLADTTSLLYNGDQFVATGTSPNLLATLSQSLLADAADGQYVDFSKSHVYVRFQVLPGTCGSACISSPIWAQTVRVDNRADFATTGAGYAQASIPKSVLNDGGYEILVSLVSNGYIVSGVASSTLTISPVATGTFITGGGHVAKDSTSNAANTKGNFGFGIKQTNKNLQGNAVYVYRMRMDVAASTPTNTVTCTTLDATCRDVDVKIKSNKLTGLVAQKTSTYPMKGHATGGISVQFIDAADGVTHYTAFEFGAGTFRLDITDSSQGGKGDMFGFTAYRKDGTVFHQAYIPASGALAQNGSASPTNQVAIGGGNVAVQPSN